MRNAMMRCGLAVAVLGLVVGVAGQAAAAPVVSFTTTGSSGDWTLDFSVTNTLGGSNEIYFFGVDMPGSTIGLIPPHWSQANSGAPWSNAGNGGSSTLYNINWIGSSGYDIAPGATKSDFEVQTNSLTAPTSVQWFAYAANGIYTGTDSFSYYDWNPGFEGIATPGVAAVPEPSTLVSAGIAGLIVGGYLWQRRRKAMLDFA